MLVIDTELCAGGTCVAVMDVATMDMAIVPIVGFLDWGWRVGGALGGITATATIEGSAAKVTSVTIAVASLESISPTTIVDATTTAAQVSLLALVLLLATLSTLCTMSLVGLLWVLQHACRGLVAK
jgi:hypothetical protein